MRIYNRIGRRQDPWHFMVVCNYYVYIMLFQNLYFFVTRYAAVHGYYKRSACIYCLFNTALIQAIALSDPVRNIIARIHAERAQCRHENDDGCHAVHIIIAVDKDFFFIRDCLFYARDRLVHAFH